MRVLPPSNTGRLNLKALLEREMNNALTTIIIRSFKRNMKRQSLVAKMRYM